tara:strand:- start:336 stop:551 length:216 start_codon:yes stop_codon:yes gene_type:complete
MPKYYNVRDTKLPKEMELDQKRGILKIKSAQTLPPIQLQIFIMVGFQTFKTQSFNVEVYDCQNYISLPYLW